MSDDRPRVIVDPRIEAYAADHSTSPSELLQGIAQATREWSDFPGMMIDGSEGKLLAMLVALSGARQVLEIGTFSGYSAISMAEALPADGHITTLELSAEHAAKAAEHIEMAGFGDRITIRQGRALETLAALDGPFDLAFIDADKPTYPAYYEAVVPLMRRGGLVIADNVLRSGGVLDASDPTPGVAGMRDYNDRAAHDPRVDTVMLTIRDGVTLSRVR
jgi:caffeoyl-CoA O-methyltransferase